MRTHWSSVINGCGLLAVLAITGCSGPVQPTQQRSASQYALSVTIVPEVVDRTTQSVVSRATSHWTGEAIDRDGHFADLRSLGVIPATFSAAPGETWTIPDTTVAQILDSLGFTPGANPSYSAPVNPPAAVDTLVSVVDGVSYQYIQNSGTFGQPLSVVVNRDGVPFTTATFVWSPVSSGGYQLSQTVIWNYSQPDVFIRTTVTVTSGQVVTFTLGRPTWRLNTASEQYNTPSLLTGLVVKTRPFVAYCTTTLCQDSCRMARHLV